MAGGQDYLAMDDEPLLAQCDIHVYKSSGPGGQHRNKVSSAVRLLHRPTRVTAHGDDSRSQHQNKRQALRRLRMNIACRLRRGVDQAGEAPPFVRQCLFVARGGPARGDQRLRIGPKDHRFWRVGGFLLDLLEACQGQLAAAACSLGVSTSCLAGVLGSERHLLAAAQEIRKRHGHKRLS